MEAASHGSYEIGGRVIGLNITKFKGDKEKDRYQYDFHQYYQNPQ